MVYPSCCSYHHFILFYGWVAFQCMAPHSCSLAWKIPWMEEPGGLPSMGSHRVGHNWSDLAAAAAFPCIDVPHSLHFSVNGHFVGFCVLAIVNSAALKIKVHMSFWMVIFSGPKLRNGIAGSYDTSMFSVSRKLCAVFHHGFTIYMPTKTLGGFHFLYILCSNYSL